MNDLVKRSGRGIYVRVTTLIPTALFPRGFKMCDL